MRGRELSAKLRRGERVYATCITSPSPRMPALAAGLGLDFVFIDTEHISLGRETVSWMCQAFRAFGLPPVVRVPKPDPYLACMMLDGGASGVIFPYVETVDEVRALRGAVRLRPLKGQRMQDALTGAKALDSITAPYLEKWNEDNVMIVNIESVPALDALDDILAVPGIDALLMGPHDLSINLGVPEQYDSPTFKEAVSLVIRKAREHNVGVGLHFSETVEQHIGWAKEGANLLIHSSDIRAVSDNLSACFRQFRDAMGDQKRTAGGTGEDTTV